ncbi:hypothetical protein BDV98DRAFT_637763 [Pterulicium gracile]|uniref:BTB domain-containing protein n=1 Tax=Pterulicium gracile TaxID=1884261 RepID=A0A5C3QVM0_9AGAR|nr:hypothetical protein BDV98DRAFT_637763 [Pterula gracilis]
MTSCKTLNFNFPDASLTVFSRDDEQNAPFRLHKGLVLRHSTVLAELCTDNQLVLDDSRDDLLHFFTAIYLGLAGLYQGPQDFNIIKAVVCLAAKYHVHFLRNQITQLFAGFWPSDLAEWDARNLQVDDILLPHPIQIINIARQVNAPQLLPAAFYDLSRMTSSAISRGFMCPYQQQRHHLLKSDLLNVLRGKEMCSRFLSTFIVNQLEGRNASHLCAYRNNPPAARTCKFAFESITLELLRDVNGTACRHSSDALFAILDSQFLSDDDRLSLHLCLPCQDAYTAVVVSARQELWNCLPSWFRLGSPV